MPKPFQRTTYQINFAQVGSKPRPSTKTVMISKLQERSGAQKCAGPRPQAFRAPPTGKSPISLQPSRHPQMVTKLKKVKKVDPAKRGVKKTTATKSKRRQIKNRTIATRGQPIPTPPRPPNHPHRNRRAKPKFHFPGLQTLTHNGVGPMVATNLGTVNNGFGTGQGGRNVGQSIAPQSNNTWIGGNVSFKRSYPSPYPPSYGSEEQQPMEETEDVEMA